MDEWLQHELSLAWGCSLEELGQRIGSREWTRWRAFAQVRPFGERGADLRVAIAVAAIVNCWVKNPREPADFMPAVRRLEIDPYKTQEQQDWHQIQDKCRMFIKRQEA